MDKPMTFIEWCSSGGKIPYSVGIEEAYEAGQQSQQAKVEELQQENLRLAYGNTSYYNQAVKQNEIIDELQKRVDKALETIAKVKQDTTDHYTYLELEELEQALKGEG
ncbi:hypothetical protein ABFK62_15360 [Acinetobacter baumannii]|uniref:hypothetical protein n=1 Tax=Acinetobacter baumannii TaxID=470 RepID=UPI000743EA87|nr:hypothetical protein [Acinetobacter baumannii]